MEEITHPSVSITSFPNGLTKKNSSEEHVPKFIAFVLQIMAYNLTFLPFIATILIAFN